jgi:hypothetical protein
LQSRQINFLESVLEVSRIFLDEFLLFFRHIFEGMNRIGPAGGNAGAAVEASLGIHIHLSGGFEPRLVLLRMDTVGGAHLDAKRVFDAVVSNYLGHGESVSRMK